MSRGEGAGAALLFGLEKRCVRVSKEYTERFFFLLTIVDSLCDLKLSLLLLFCSLACFFNLVCLLFACCCLLGPGGLVIGRRSSLCVHAMAVTLDDPSAVGLSSTQAMGGNSQFPQQQQQQEQYQQSPFDQGGGGYQVRERARANLPS